MRARGWLMVLLTAALTLGCGGRASKADSSPESSGGTASVDQPPGEAAAGSGGTATSTMTPGAAFEPFDPLSFATAPADIPDGFEVPSWIGVHWLDSINERVADVCAEGLTAEEAQIRVNEAFREYPRSGTVTADELSAYLAQIRDPATQVADSRWLYLFMLPDQAMGGVLVTNVQHDSTFSYLLFDRNCTPHRVGYYVEHARQSGCSRFEGFPIWGVPDTLTHVRECYPTNGLYGFEAKMLEDTCERSPKTFQGFIAYEQYAATHAKFWFTTLPTERLASWYELAVEDGRAHYSDIGGGPAECPDFMQGIEITIAPGAHFDVLERDFRCSAKEIDDCTWRMQSTSMYGPL